MTQEQMLEQIVKQVMAAMGSEQPAQTCAPSTGDKVTAADYPIADKRPDLIKTATGKNFTDLSYEKGAKS